MTQSFVALYKPGPAWLEGKSFSEQPLLEHGSFLKYLHDHDRLLFAGPFTDDTGGINVFTAESQEQAETIIAEDPAVISGVFTVTLHPWLDVDWDTYQ